MKKLKTHQDPYPHPGGCNECRRLDLCNYCGKKGQACTNGRCSECDRRICTEGGITYPGHYWGKGDYWK